MTTKTEIRSNRWRRTCFACWTEIRPTEKYARTITWTGRDAAQLVEHVECSREAARLAGIGVDRPLGDDVSRRGWLVDAPEASQQWHEWFARRNRSNGGER